MNGKLTFNMLLKMLKLPWNLEIHFFKENSLALKKNYLLNAHYNYKDKSIELNCNLKGNKSGALNRIDNTLDYDFRSREYEVMIFLKMGKYFLNNNLCNKKNCPYILTTDNIRLLIGNVYTI